MIGVVTGTYNRQKFLQAMIESARASARGIPIHFYIVDGGSTDGTLDYCKAQSDVLLIRQDGLYGATRAFSPGFAICPEPFVVVANDDIEFMDDTIRKSFDHLQNSPTCGAVAYLNRISSGDYLMHPYGYLTPQCGMVRHWVGDLAGWWSTDYHTYAADTELGLRIWELGLTVDDVDGCVIIDKQPVDGLRIMNQGQRDRNVDHPDNVLFKQRWEQDGHPRMEKRSEWRGVPKETLFQKAALGKLRTLRFKIHPQNSGPVRTGMIRAFERRGTAIQIVTDDYKHRFRAKPHKFQVMIENEIDAFEPDLVLFQIQGIGDVLPQTIEKLRGLYPDTVFCNFNGDVRNEVEQVLIDVAKECHLTLLASPDLFSEYHTRGADNVAYWPIAVDPEYLVATRDKEKEFDVVFLGSHYPNAEFPLSQERYDIVEALHKSDLKFGLFGFGWPESWKVKYTADDTPTNISIYERAKLAVSVSQFDLWGYTSDRLYRICATGCPAVVKTYKGMKENGFIDGENCYAFDDHSTVVDVCQEGLSSWRQAHTPNGPRMSEVIGAAGHQLILDRHNYDRRVDELLLMLDRL